MAEDKGWLGVGLDTDAEIVIPEVEADEEEDDVVIVDEELEVELLLSAKVFACSPVFEVKVIPFRLLTPTSVQSRHQLCMTSSVAPGSERT